jgi:hypothetical protein
MRTPPEPGTMDELISDCDEMPTSLRAENPAFPLPRPADPWQVTDTNLAQVHEIDEYV